MRYLNGMPTKKDILCFPADADLLERIDDYRYEKRIPSRSEAMRRLIEEGLMLHKKRGTKTKERKP
jgi:metal-responsive CopG/Arc/MetJ family transcriptional regulator